jgi:hypothetical protein
MDKIALCPPGCVEVCWGVYTRVPSRWSLGEEGIRRKDAKGSTTTKQSGLWVNGSPHSVIRFVLKLIVLGIPPKCFKVDTIRPL